MPSALTALLADNVTTVVFDPLAGATERSPAMWRQDAGQNPSIPSGMRPMFELGSAFNGPRTARRLTFKYWSPYAIRSTDTGTYSAPDQVLISGTIILPTMIPSAIHGLAVHQGLSLLGSLAVRNIVSTGYAPV